MVNIESNFHKCVSSNSLESRANYLQGCKPNLLDSCQYSFKACDLNLAQGCLNAGVCLNEGLGGLPMNKQESLVYFNKACDDKNPIACNSLFKMYLDGSKEIPQDKPRALEYAKKACDFEDMFGCWNASLMLKRGDGIPKDEALAEMYRQKVEEIKRQHEVAGPQVVMGEQHK